MNMHPGELTLTREMIIDLIETQLPEYRDLLLSEKDYAGTVNHVYRLGEDLYLRLPRMPHSIELIKEAEWLEYLQAHMTVKLPRPLRICEATEEYPAVWGVFEWIHGETCVKIEQKDEARLAVELSDFVKKLQSLPVPENAPFAGRLPLAELDQKTQDAIAACRDMFEEPDMEQRLLKIWTEALEAAPWDGKRYFIHTDLLKTNVMQADGKLQAILDFGGFGAGDPAFDLIPAWAIFGPEAREIYRSRLNHDEDTWTRAKAYALHQAVFIIPYYVETYPEFVETAKYTVRQIVMDTDANCR